MFANFWMNCIGRESLIAVDDTWGLLAVLCVGVFISIWLEQKYQWASKISGAIIASNANIGGPTTAAGMAISQGWNALVGSAMLIGTMGYVVGNYLGTVVAISLGL